MPTRVSFVVDDSEVRAMELLIKIQGLKKVSFRGMTDITITLVPEPVSLPSPVPASEQVNIWQESIQQLSLPTRTLNCLQHALVNNINGIPERREDCDISTIGQLVAKTRSEILTYFDIGPRRADEIEANLAQIGLRLKQEENPT